MPVTCPGASAPFLRLQPRVEDPHHFAVATCVRSRLRIAAADQVVNFLRRLGPIDFGVLVAAWRIVSCFRFVLDDARRVAGVDQVDGFADGFHAKRENFVEIERTGGVVGIDLNFLLQQNRPGIDALIDPEKAKAP